MNKVKKYFKYEFLSGYLNVGKNITIYGRNAMAWGVNIRTKKYGFICFRLPLFCFGKFPKLYFYLSPDGTPNLSTYFIGKKHDKESWTTSRIRCYWLGHNFDIESNKKTVEQIKYFNPGNFNLLVDVMKRSKASIKAWNMLNNTDKDILLIEDLKRYINIYGGYEE